ncbi:MAG: CIA30 family protein [Nitrospirota bacterium]|nr:MAG: CIA30 family protein [Nitrospirota bacterium]
MALVIAKEVAFRLPEPSVVSATPEFSEGAVANSSFQSTGSERTGAAEGESAMSEIDKPPNQSGFSNNILGVNLFDFDGNGPAWYSVNDVVMGGVSRSSANIDPEKKRLSFSGILSLENNGGFASIRSQEGTYDLSAYEGIALRVRGDGKIYRFRIRTEETGPEIAYTALFKTKNDSWQEIYIPFSEMIPIYRGVVVNGVEALDPASIRSFGLMLSERQQGEFSLEVDTIVAVDANINILEGADSEAG